MTQQKVLACVIRCGVANNARGHSHGCSQGSCGFIDADGKGVESYGDQRPFFFCRPKRVEPTCDDIVYESHQLASTTLPADINEKLSRTIRKAGVSMATWRSNGLTPIRLTLFQSLLLARHVGGGGVGGAILPDLSLFVAVKIPLAGSPRDRLSPPHPSLTRRPLSLNPALASGSTGAGGSWPGHAELVCEFGTVALAQ